MIMNDSLILKFCCHLVQKHSSDSYSQEFNIWERTRVLAKFLIPLGWRQVWERWLNPDSLIILKLRCCSQMCPNFFQLCSWDSKRNWLDCPQMFGPPERIKPGNWWSSFDPQCPTFQWPDGDRVEWSFVSLNKQHQKKMKWTMTIHYQPILMSSNSWDAHIIEASNKAYQDLIIISSKSNWHSMA